MRHWSRSQIIFRCRTGIFFAELELEPQSGYFSGFRSRRRLAILLEEGAGAGAQSWSGTQSHPKLFPPSSLPLTFFLLCWNRAERSIFIVFFLIFCPSPWRIFSFLRTRSSCHFNVGRLVIINTAQQVFKNFVVNMNFYQHPRILLLRPLMSRYIPLIAFLPTYFLLFCEAWFLVYYPST